MADEATRDVGERIENLEREFVGAGIKLERFKILTHQGPVETTLKEIKSSGLLSTLGEIQKKQPGAITEIVVTPILPATGRWEITDNPFDRLFVMIRPDLYDQVVAELSQRGFGVDEDHPSGGSEPYFFSEHGNRFCRGVHNRDVFIVETDFLRPEKLVK